MSRDFAWFRAISRDCLFVLLFFCLLPVRCFFFVSDRNCGLSEVAVCCCDRRGRTNSKRECVVFVSFAFCCGCAVVLLRGFFCGFCNGFCCVFHNLPLAVVIGGVRQIPSVNVSYSFLSRFVVVVLLCVVFVVVFVMDFVVFHNLPFAVVIGGVRQIPSVNVSYLFFSRFVAVVLLCVVLWLF